MNIYKSKGKPKKYKITDNPLEDKDWEYVIGGLPRRISPFRNETNVDLTEEEIRALLSSKKSKLEEVIEAIEQAEEKL